MKKHAAVLLLAMTLLLSLCACTQESRSSGLTTYTVDSYTITQYDGSSGTISDGTHTYSYSSVPSSGHSVTFTYPDGETYTWTENSGGGWGTSSPNLDLSKYPSGLTLKSVLERGGKADRVRTSQKNVGLIVVFLLIGAVNTAAPKAAWFLEVGWKLKDAEPSDAALAWNRGIGILLLVIAAVMLIV